MPEITSLTYRIRWIMNKIISLFILKNNIISPDGLFYKIYNFFHKKVTNRYKNIICVSGFLYSGSSAVIGLLSEFNRITTVGCSDAIYSKNITNKLLHELIFLRVSHLFPLIRSFEYGSIMEKDCAIKNFIKDIYVGYKDRRLHTAEYNPSFYSYQFLINSTKFLLKIIDTDDTTRQILTRNKLPYVFNNKSSQFNNCSFMIGEGINQFIWYKFKDISKHEFDLYVKEYIDFILHFTNSKDFLVCDQLIPGTSEDLSLLRHYEPSALQICVYRDPRDQFLSAFRWCLDELPRNIDSFVAFYNKKNFETLFAEASPYRLMVRFEDLVLKYEETTRKIMDFCGLDPADHMTPKMIFDPAMSAVNIGAYKYFVDQDFMRQIEERLGEYCYYPEKENLSDAAWKLLRTTRS